MVVWKAVTFHPCDFFLFLPSYLGQPAMELAEIWHADQKLV